MNKRNYEPISRRARAAQYRRDADECEASGFTVFAEINREMATLLDAPKPEPKEP